MKRALVATTAVLLAATLLLFARAAYPTPGTDAPSFLASAINHRLGRGLVNPLYPQIRWADPSGGARHVYYPPLFPLVVSALLPSPTPQGAFTVVALLQGVSLALGALLGWRLIASGGEPAWPAVLLLMASLAGLGTSLLPTQGRAEALALVLLLLGALALVGLRGSGRVAALGLLLGLMAATHPIGAVEAGLVAALVFAFGRPAREVLPELLLIALLAAAVFAAALAFTPHGLGETLQGMARAYPHTPWTAPPGRDWWRPWILLRRATFYGPLFLLALAGGVALLRRRAPAARALFALAAVLLAAVFYHGSLTHKSLRNYNAILLAPLAYALVLAWFARAGRALRAACFVTVAATAAGLAGYALCFPWYRAHAHTLARARAEWAALPLPPERRVLLRGNLWALSEDYARIDLDPRLLDDPARARPILVLGQRREHAGRPPAVPGFRLLHDGFDPALTQAGWRRRFVDEDYSFAVYLPQ
jgi:hypothetical protein